MAQATLGSVETQVLQHRDTAPSQFSAHVCCGQTAGWIKMPLGTEVHLGPYCVKWGPISPTERGTAAPLLGLCLLWPNARLSQQLLSCYKVHPTEHRISHFGDKSFDIVLLLLATAILWPLYRITCVSQHLQLRTGEFCWSKALLPACPC